MSKRICGVDWACPSFLRKLIIVQKKICRCMFFIHKYDSVAPALSTTSFMTFNVIHTLFTLFLIYKNVRNYVGKKIFNIVGYATKGQLGKIILIYAALSLEHHFLKTALYVMVLNYSIAYQWLLRTISDQATYLLSKEQ